MTPQAQPEPDHRHLIEAAQLRIAANRLALTRRQQLTRIQPGKLPRTEA